MDISSSQSRLLVMVVVLLAHSCGRFAADNVDRVCSRTIHSTNCQQFLRSDPRAGSAPYTGLGIIATSMAILSINDFEDLVRQLRAQAIDNEVSRRLRLCLSYTLHAIDELLLTKQFLMKEEFLNMSTHASRVYNTLGLCDNLFAKPPNEPWQLQQANGKQRDIADVIRSIASILIGA